MNEEQFLKWKKIKNLVQHHQAKLLVASKGRCEQEIIPFLKMGHRLFGESRLQESLKKWVSLKDHYPDVELHFIGQLQSNKAHQVAENFHCIQSVDRLSIVKALAHAFERLSLKRDVYIQVNLGKEPQKGGVYPENFFDFLNLCKGYNLPVKGVMAIPPAQQNPAPYFKMLKQISFQAQLKEVSMGMSDDYVEALQQGSTMIRVGSILF